MGTMHAENRLDDISGTDTVQLENCNKAILRGIGSLIYRAARSDAEFQSLRKDTARRFADAGVPEKSLENMHFYVFKDESTLVNVVVPEVKDLGNTPDDAYLVELGLVTLRACKRA